MNLSISSRWRRPRRRILVFGSSEQDIKGKANSAVDAWNNSDGDLPSDSGSENLLVSP